LQGQGQTDRRFVVGGMGVHPCRFVPVFMRIAPARQMDAAVSFGMRMRVQQRRHALQQGEQVDQKAAMNQAHGPD